MNTDLTAKIPFREHIKNIKKILKIITGIDKWYFLFTSIVHIINVIVPYIQLILSAYILDAIIAQENFKEVILVITGTLFIILCLNFTASSIWNRMEVRRERAYLLYSCMTQTRMLDMDFSRIDSPEIKELRNRIMTDNNWGAGINSLFWQGNSIIFGLFNIIGAAVVAFPVISFLFASGRHYVIIVFLVLAIILIVSMKAGIYFKKKTFQFMFSKIDESEKEDLLVLSWHFASGNGFNYKNGKDIRIYGSYRLMERWSISAFSRKKNRKILKNSAIGWAGKYGSSEFATSAIRGCAYLSVTLAAIAGKAGAGDIIRLAGCLDKLFTSAYNLVNDIAEFALTARKQASTIEFLELDDEMYKGKLPVEKRSDNEYQIEFKNVTFCYPGSNEPALKDFSMKLKIGEKLAVVGMNGSGKTTMIKLLCRLYDPDKGEILLNGVDIRKFKTDEYRQLFSVVFQDYTLFPFQLAQNVATDTEYNSELVKKCLVDAGFGERINNGGMGMETYLYKDYDDNGIEISGGEAQKIAIARAMYKNSPFVLLDEPTAALDPLAEYEIYTNFDKIIGTKTAIYISHRLSSCQFCEKIAVFHKGSLVQYGSHKELLEDTKGKYYEMWNAQAQYYQ
ncbi:MAG: ABC transporter ATP-binding protein/permease [Lachnospiraceae bacterium]|nr:ABC transporter ATP-binding protein/permease [Lachnospiraceae bacterium]